MSNQDHTFPPDVATRLLEMARESIRSYLADKPLPRASTASPLLDRPSGAFVTLKQRGWLRGCIGRVEADWPLWETVARMARAAAFEDPRFAPLSEFELGDVSIEVSIMTPPVPIARPEDVVAGTHGVVVQRGFNRGLFLPQVATENQWDREQLLDQVCLKAGLLPGAWRDPDVDIFVFTAVVIAE